MPDTPPGVARYIRPDDAIGQRLVRFATTQLPALDFDEACAFYASLREAAPTPAHLAALGLCDRYFLLTGILGRADALHPWLYDRCREVEAAPDGHLDLWARNHYKSTVITFAGIIQEILRDPEITIGVFAHTRPIAKAFLNQIKREFESNELLKALYSDVLWQEPARQSPKWSENEGLIVKRRTNPKEATLEASGLVDGQPTSRHYRLRVYDDVVTRESVTTPEQVRKTTEAYELSDNLGTKAGRVWAIGTRYSYGDTYGTLLARGVLIPRIYAATDNGRLDGNPVFLSPEDWEAKKIAQPSSIAAQMLQNPIAGEDALFRPEWLQSYLVRPETLDVYILVDPSRGRSATSDRTAMAVIGVDSAGNKYLLDGYRHRMTLSERWQALKTLYRHWSAQPGVLHVRIGYERYGQQTDNEYFDEAGRRERVYLPIEEVSWPREGGHSKRDRVSRLEPDIRLGRFRVPGIVLHETHGISLWRHDTDRSVIEYRPIKAPPKAQASAIAAGQAHRVAKAIRRKDESGRLYDLTSALIEEMTTFPFGSHDDLIDACSRIYDMAPMPAVRYAPQDLEPNTYWDS